MRTILVVEDEDSTARMFQMVLERSGYHVLSAGNGFDALQLLDAAPVDLVLSDVMLPTMSGVELCCRMRNDPRYRAIPFIFISAVPQSGLDEACSYQAFLQKPVHVDALLSTIGAVLDPAQP